MKLKKMLLGSVAVAALTSSFTQNAIAQKKRNTVSKHIKTQKNMKYIDPSNMDLSVKPGDDFFTYANGAWLRKTSIPASQTRWGSFNELIEKNSAHLHEILNEAARHEQNADRITKNVGDFYKSGMDSAQINKAGIQPVAPILQRIDQIKNLNDFWEEVALEHTEGIGTLFGFGVGPDDKNVSEEICNFYQGGMGLPTKDYYTASDPRTTKIRNAYLQYIGDILSFTGNKDQASVTQIFNFEAALAAAAMSPVEMRDPQKLYNKFTLTALEQKYPNIHFQKILSGLKIPASYSQSVIVAMPVFFETLNHLDTVSTIETLKNYLKFHVISAMAPFLSNDISEVRFNFYGKTLSGQQEQDPRWKRVMHVIDGSIGDELGQMYVSKYFKPEAKAYMLRLVNNLQATYAERIQALDWMSNATKTKALQKLNAFTKKIGYPDQWKDYSGLTIVPDNYAANVLNASKFEYDYQVQKLGKPVDRKEWGMTPPTVNAYYNPAFNEIVFPAGILQFPFFDFNADDAVNYGGIGAVIGHEMTHGFDDQGRQYDAEGNLKDWWTADDAQKFKEKTDVVVKQFDNYTILDTVHINGQLTLGENLADLGGITIAYQAFKKTKQGQSDVKIDGFTPDQRFFLSWAQVWRSKIRPEAAFQRIKTDPHAPGEWRANGPLTNFEPFYKAFDVKPGNKMYVAPDKRAIVW